VNDRSQGGSDRVDDGLDNPSDHTGEAITTLAGPGAGAVTLAAAGNELERFDRDFMNFKLRVCA
jgi:hypothetical protein